MYQAIAKSDTKKVLDLLSKVANPNLKSDKGSSLPLYVIGNKNVTMVKLLLDHKADASYNADYKGSSIEYAQMRLGYPSLNGNCHPIVHLFRESIED